MARPRRLFLIDGSSQMYRAYHAIRGLTGPDGRSTNAVYGFVTMLRKLVADHQPELLAAAFDLAGPTFRSDLAADYKANRAPMPPDLAEQIPWVHEACEALGVPVLTYSRYEADDVLGTLALRAVRDGFQVALVTGDKDFFQLVDDDIQVYNPRDDGTWYDAEGVKQKFGVAPHQVVDVLALMGDTIDNVKGVPGIGEKSARDLIATYGTLEALLEAAPTLAQKRQREALTANGHLALESRELVRIHTDVPVECDPATLDYRGPDRARCYALFSRLGFRTLVGEFAPTAASVEKAYARVTSRAALDALAASLRALPEISAYVLADEDNALRASIVGVALSVADREAWYVPVAGPHSPAAAPGGLLFDAPAESGESIGTAEVAEVLGPVLGNAAVRKTGHDLKRSLLLLSRHGIPFDGLGDDALLASYVLDATKSSHAIEPVALEELGYKAATDEDVRGKGVKATAARDLAPDVQCELASERADIGRQLAHHLAAKVREASLDAVYRDLELPLVPVLAEMERAGIRVNGDTLRALSSRIDAELASRSGRIHALAGLEFNINSPKQLAEVLFDKLQLPVSKKTGKTRTASTAVDVLEELALSHEICRDILEWRALSKLKGTYIDALPALTDPATGRVHTSFNQAVAATGRLSSSDPNLQNIPIRTELGREIRGAFVADPDCCLISADYSQIELRVLAHLSKDTSLVESFQRGDDIHDRTARAVFGENPGLDPYELRRRAKIINYALLYGKTAFTLARDIGVSQQAAQAFIDAYFAGFPGVRAFIDETLARARVTGVVTTMFGRRRLVPEITSRNGQVRSAAERVAVNMPIQGSAADILKRAMLDLHAALAARPSRGGPRARMILTVHDELLFEVPRNEAEDVAWLVRTHMENAVPLAVPLTVEVGVGENWKAAKA